MSTDTTKARYETLRRILDGQGAFTCSPLDPVCAAVFPGYEDSVLGYTERQRVRAAVPDIYKQLSKVDTIEKFEAIVARLKLELLGGS